MTCDDPTSDFHLAVLASLSTPVHLATFWSMAACGDTDTISDLGVSVSAATHGIAYYALDDVADRHHPLAAAFVRVKQRSTAWHTA